MRGNEFLDKLELVDPAFVETADELPQRKGRGWQKWSGLAACVCLIAAVVLAFAAPYKGVPEPVPDPDPLGTVTDGPAVSTDRPQELTSDTYGSLTELLDYLSAHDGHLAMQSNDGMGGYSAAHAAMEGADTVSFQGTVYQINHTTEKWTGIYQNGLLTGTVDAPADYLFVSDGRLVTVGAEYYSGTELDSVHCVRVNIFDLADPVHPAALDSYTQLGDLTACWLAGGQLYLLTDDGVCACGYSRLDALDSYKPQLFHGEDLIPWAGEDISILGEPSRVSYVAVSRIMVKTMEVMGKHAYYGDIEEVFYGEDWFALVTESTMETAYTLQDVYTFNGSLIFTGKVDLAEVFGLKKTLVWSENTEPPRETQYPKVKSVSKEDGIWRMVGQSHYSVGPTWFRELFAVTYDPEGGETITQALQMPEEQFDIDDVLWESDRAIISAGYVHLGAGADEAARGTRLVFAQFDGGEITLLASDLICDRVQGVDGIYSYGSPLGRIKPFIALGDGLYLRYNEIPDGFDLYDLSDSVNPRCLYKSQGDIPEGCRLDFDSYVLNEHTLAVSFIAPGTDSGYRDAALSWAVFTVDPSSDSPVTLQEKQYSLTGIDPAAIPLP